MFSSQCLNAQVVSTMLSTLNVMFNVTYYLELHNAISLTTNMFFVSFKVVNVLSCPNNQFDICW